MFPVNCCFLSSACPSLGPDGYGARRYRCESCKWSMIANGSLTTVRCPSEGGVTIPAKKYIMFYQKEAYRKKTVKPSVKHM